MASGGFNRRFNIITMKLNKFIKELEKISRRVSKSDKIKVEMADCIPVVKPIFKDGTVFITDIDSEISE